MIFHSYVKLPEGKLVMISLILFVHMNDDYSKETMIPPPPFFSWTLCAWWTKKAQEGWMVFMENPKITWMRTGGTPIYFFFFKSYIIYPYISYKFLMIVRTIFHDCWVYLHYCWWYPIMWKISAGSSSKCCPFRSHPSCPFPFHWLVP